MDPMIWYRRPGLPGDLSPMELDARGRYPDGSPYAQRAPMRLRAARPRHRRARWWHDVVDWFTP